MDPAEPTASPEPTRRRPAVRPVIAVAIAVAGALLAVGAVILLGRDPARDLWEESARYSAAGRTEEARVLFELIVRDHPRSRYASSAARELGIMNPAPVPEKPLEEYRPSPSAAALSPAEKLYNEARSFYPLGTRTRSDLEEAAKRYDMLADSWPRDPLAGDALFAAASCIDQVGEPERRLRAWRKFIDRHPYDGRISEALYAVGFLLYNEMGRRDEGRKRFEELIERYPESNAAEAARAALGIAEPQPGEAAGTSKKEEEEGRPSILTAPGGM